ncbi:hypothetical protein DC083_06870 [Ignatzschineria ureiclastica]|uniref:Uncharacterized protein n=1 Tax=Ignatzschineria ureiclastica TaxID=472582 RepID=A0A2U2ADT3_9GAMM|nr:hypothetical protein [Ignatzschineria ureiclastica]PWD80822.1 hypothetical protein DC083_06870 [Ignatzschineria ureiclastica]GGZ94476.1 hypothetical protein GCM10007162_07810 [Ignatzschineria ureiclastica]
MKSFVEMKLLREREWRAWKQEYLREKIHFLEFTWALDEDSIAQLQMRLALAKDQEIYRTPIVDSAGKVHNDVRTRELEVLYNFLISERSLRERRAQGKWMLIQSARNIAELPVIRE